MFDGKKYVTRGVAETIPLDMQCFMWDLIDQMSVDKDYLQVFSLSVEGGKQRLTHIQEMPEYKKSYVVNGDTKISCKIFVIDDVEYSTMLLASEY